MKRFYIFRLLVLANILLWWNWNANAQTTTFTVAGTYIYTVTAGSTAVIDMQGGTGGSSCGSGGSGLFAHGGYGGRVQAVLTISPGEVLYVVVGGAGGNGASNTIESGGYNNTTATGGYCSSICCYDGGGGGGASEICVGSTALTNRLVVAGGGGGGGANFSSNYGGNGGGTTAQAGQTPSPGAEYDGPGATPGGPGLGGTYGTYGTSGSGTSRFGGYASSYPSQSPGSAGGGGGGGYYGGAGGSWGGGGGGNSYTDPVKVTSYTHTQGYNTAGTGSVSITVLCNTAGSIAGNAPVCIGQTAGLSNTAGSLGGTWSSNNTSVASVNVNTGVVSGLGQGTTIITYNIANPCTALPTAVVTVNPLPNLIGGLPSVCTGVITPFSETTTGGVWSSSNSSSATVDGSGNVTGVGPGSAGIIYTLPTSCSISYQVSVNSAPGPILGTATVCKNSTTLLTDVVSGGTWSSGAGTIATVSSSGNVGGVGTGSSNISYTLSTGCSVSKSVTVEGLPNQYVVEGGTTYCADSTDTVTLKLNSSDAPSIGISYQVFSGPLPVGSPLTGTGGALYFSPPSSPGTYTIVGTNTTTGCVNTMNLSATVTTRAIPNLFTVTGGGSYCQYGTGVPDGLSGSSSGINYKLYYNGAATTESLPGNGSPLSFGSQGGAGTYTVVGSYSTNPACPITMSGNAVVSISSLPAAHNVTVANGGNYCSGGAGVAVGLDYADAGISYQLYYNGGISGIPVTGTGGTLSFGLQTAVGDYSVVATNTSTSCTNNMTGIVSVNIVLPPPSQNVIVSGNPTGCVGSSYPDISLDGSAGGVNYQLYKGSVAVGSFVPGTGAPIDLGIYTDSGTYTIVATDQTYFCTSTMTGSAVINLSPLPVTFNVTGGGSYCEFGAGVAVTLDGSQPGIAYTLSNGAATSTLYGTGSPLNFGNWTDASTYTISALNTTTFCSSNMAGSAAISINPLPLPFNVIGGGSYCAGSIGIDLGLDHSEPGVNYQLYNGALSVGASLPGTGDTLDFGYHTPAGTYSVVGKNPLTGCVANMSGSETIVINALPNLHTVNGGGSYCSGGTGDSVNLNGSDAGITYQLYNGVTPMGSPVAGTGAAISFGLQTLGGTYSVIATNSTTQCTKNMSGVATIVVNVTPSPYTMTGGGIYCAGTSGVHIGLSGSNAGVHYLLYDGIGLESTITGTGSAIDFGLETGTGTYTVVAKNASTGCSNNMTGDAVVATNMPPTAYAVIGGGGYCTGSSVIPSVGLGGSDAGVSYQLYHGSAAVGSTAGGTGAPLDFGAQTAAGTYTIVATNPATGCTMNMSGSASVALNPLPSVYTVTGGGSYCAGGDGYHIYMSISNPGISYILYQGTTVIDTIAGTGAGVDFGLQTVAGSYTAIAVNPATGCMSNMTGSAVVVINPLPAVHTVTVADGGNYCVTGSGVAVGLDGSNSGITYQLYNGLITVGASIGGAGSAVNFGVHPAGNYTVVASNAVTGCTSNMTGSAMVTAIPLPNVYATTGGGNYCTTGLGLHVGIGSSDLGTQYQLYYAATPTGVPTISGIPVLGTSGALDFGLFTGAGTYTVVGINGGSLGCSSNMSGAAVIAIYPVVIPTVSIATAGGDTACEGVTTHFTASSINGGVSPIYNWSVNGVTQAYGTSTYSYVPIDGDIVKASVQSDGICAIPDTASTQVIMTVSPPKLPTVSVTAVPGKIICEGSPVTFNAAPMYSGSHPTYTWLKNSVNVVGAGLSYTYIPANNDNIVLMMGSSFPCRTADTVFSNPINMEVDPAVIPKVTITANPGTQIAPGQNVTLKAAVINGGSAPAYQWLINGTLVNGATNAIFTSNSLADNDSVACDVTGVCDLKSFNSVRMHVGDEGVQQITGTGSNNIKLVPNPNKGLFTIKGTLDAAGDEEVTIEVVNMLGQTVYSNKVMSQSGNINETLQLSGSLANGMYILNLRSGTQNSVFHFVIEQ